MRINTKMVGQVVGIWFVIHGVSGAVMFGVTTFLFAFSGGQAGMVPVVTAGFWVVGAVVLAAGLIVARRTRTQATAVQAMLLTVVVAWSMAVFIEWRLSFPLGSKTFQSRQDTVPGYALHIAHWDRGTYGMGHPRPHSQAIGPGRSPRATPCPRCADIAATYN